MSCWSRRRLCRRPSLAPLLCAAVLLTWSYNLELAAGPVAGGTRLKPGGRRTSALAAERLPTQIHSLDALRAACASTAYDDADRLELPVAAWTRLRLAGGWACPAAGPDTPPTFGSTFPIREAVRLYLSSEHLRAAAARGRHTLLLSPLPLAFAGDGVGLVAEVSAARACSLAARLPPPSAPPAGGAAAPVATVQPDLGSIVDELCGDGRDGGGSSSLRRGPPPEWLFFGDEFGGGDSDDDSDGEADNSGLYALTRRCDGGRGGSGGAYGASPPFPSSSSVWTALFGLPHAGAAAGAVEVPCGARLRPRDMLARLTANVMALAQRAPLPGGSAQLHMPAETRDAVLRYAPTLVGPSGGKQLDDPMLPLVYQNVAEIAEAAGRGDTAAIRAALTAPGQGDVLMGALTAYNVVVSPLGLLQAVAGAGAGARRVLRATGNATAAYVELLQQLYEDEPAHMAAGTRAAVDGSDGGAFMEASLGGPVAVASLRARSPFCRFNTYWPPYAGPRMTEVPYEGGAGGRVFFATQVLTPGLDDEVVERPAAVTAWDRQAIARALQGGDHASLALPVYEEVVVVTPTADSFYWLSAEVIGRLALLLPYLRAHPHVVIHVPYFLRAHWVGGHHGAQWFASLGLADRLVSGRVVAHIAHVLDATVAGPHTHPLQLLGLRDAMAEVAPEVAAAHAGDGGALQQARSRRVLVIDRSRAGSRRQHPADLAALITGLRAYGLTVVRFTGAGPLAASLASWASVGAAVGPHGAGLTNALALAPGSTVAELVPAGHAHLAWYYLNAAHIGRLLYHHALVPGILTTGVRGGVDHLLWAVCGGHDHRLAGCNATAPEPGVARGLLPVLPRDVLCPPAEVADAPPLPPPAADEPLHALAPWGVVHAGLTAWMSPPAVLPLTRVRALLLVLLPGDSGPEAASTSPAMRPLLRAAEAQGLLPVAVPLGILSDAAGDNSSHTNRTTDSCTHNADLHATVALLARVLAAVRAARGLSASAPVPVAAYGLGPSGAAFTGVLAARVRLVAAVAQGGLPHALAARVSAGGVLAPEPGCAAALARAVDEAVAAGGGGADASSPLSAHLEHHLIQDGSAAPVPSLWVTANALRPAAVAAARTFAARLLAAGVPRARLVTHPALPPALCPHSLADRAPWLFSAAASAAVVELLWSFGLLTRSASIDAALAAARVSVVCEAGGNATRCADGSSPLHPARRWAGGSADDDSAESDDDDVVAEAVAQAGRALVYAHAPPHTHDRRAPLLYAAAGDADFLAGATALLVAPLRGAPACAAALMAPGNGGDGSGAASADPAGCAEAAAAWVVVASLLAHAAGTLQGGHRDYYTATDVGSLHYWGALAGWLDVHVSTAEG